jgi:hypothetical protein
MMPARSTREGAGSSALSNLKLVPTTKDLQ